MFLSGILFDEDELACDFNHTIERERERGGGERETDFIIACMRSRRFTASFVALFCFG